MSELRLSATAVAVLAVIVCAGLRPLGAYATGSAAGRATRATLWARVERRCGGAAAEQLPPYPWPIAPVNRQHPVRGYFGDPRTVLTGPGEGAFSFHNGVDISAWPGNHVLPVVSGVVTEVRPDRVVVSASDDRRFQYIHIHPRVRVGTHVLASKTVLGTVDPVAHHVHLSEIRGICVVNPLMPGHLTPYRDTTRPVVRAILFENVAGQLLSPLALSGRVRVIANALDRPAMPSPAPWKSLRVSPALISWRLTTLKGRILQSEIAVDFRGSLPPRRDFCSVYAPGTTQNFAAVLGRFRWGKPGRYLYDLTPTLFDTQLLRQGRYRFVVSAADTAGNTGEKSVVIEVRRLVSEAALKPVADSRCEPR